MKYTLLFLWFLTLCKFSYQIHYKQQCTEMPSTGRVDCHPDVSASYEKCIQRGCCWMPDDNSGDIGSDQGVPYCFFQDYPSYKVVNTKEIGNGVLCTLHRITPSPWPHDINTLQLQLIFMSEKSLRIRFIDPLSPRYEVPIALNTTRKKFNLDDSLYSVKISNEPWVRIVVIRKSTGRVLLDTNMLDSPLIYSDKFLQISYGTESVRLIGPGENRASLYRRFDAGYHRDNLWNRDVPPTLGDNLYGSHPFYVAFEEASNGTTNAHGVFLLNSNSLEFETIPGNQGGVTWRTIGGILDFFIFLGPRPDDVVTQYTSLIGRPSLPPFWSLGFHLCRYGYQSADEIFYIVNRTLTANIPLDTQWSDIDYMAAYRDFTYGRNFFLMPELAKFLHASNMHLVIILDPGISNTMPAGAYYPYDGGLTDHVFVKAYDTDKPLVGKVWPGNTVFPDFSNPKTFDYWKKLIKTFLSVVPVDGLWIDMNEPSNFVDGSLDGCPSGTGLDDELPYLPSVLGGSLYSKTLCTSSQHFLSSHFNLHNLYGMMEMNVTHRALKELLNQRPFVLSRSTFSGAGQYGGHWTGDNFASFEDMYYSITDILKFATFGFSLLGSDVCGFRGDTNDELCIRWTQLGAFYPFMRNHNAIGQKDQDPASFNAETQASIRKALKMRYTLLPVLYTYFWRASTHGLPIWRPMSYVFPDDPKCSELDTQFFLGDAILVAPILKSGANTVNVYFSEGTWYNLGPLVGMTNVSQVYKGNSYYSVDSPLDVINAFVHGGNAFMMMKPASNTWQQRKQGQFYVLAAADVNGQANGQFYWDDGVSLDIETSYSLLEIQLNLSTTQGTMRVSPLKTGYGPIEIYETYVFGVHSRPDSVSLNGVNVKYDYVLSGQLLIVYVQYDGLVSSNVTWIFQTSKANTMKKLSFLIYISCFFIDVLICFLIFIS